MLLRSRQIIMFAIIAIATDFECKFYKIWDIVNKKADPP